MEDEALVPVADQHDVRENHPVLLELLDIIQRLNDDVGTGSPRLEVPVVLVLHDELQHLPVNLRVDEPVALERVRDGRVVEEERYLLVVDVLDFTLDFRFLHRCIDAFHSMDSFVVKLLLRLCIYYTPDFVDVKWASMIFIILFASTIPADIFSIYFFKMASTFFAYIWVSSFAYP